jgi:CRP-like cAMP-binding protein
MTANCPATLPPCAELFAGLQGQTAAALWAMGRVRSWRRQEHLYLAGQLADTLHFLLSGRLKEYYGDAAGEEWLRRVIHLGEMVFAFSSASPAPATLPPVSH